MVYIQGADTGPFLFLGTELASDAQQALGVYLLNEQMMVCFGTKGISIKMCILVGGGLFRNLDAFSFLTCFPLACFQTGFCSIAQESLELIM